MVKSLNVSESSSESPRRCRRWPLCSSQPSCIVEWKQTIKAFLPIISVPLWWLSALGLIVVLVVVILVSLVAILVIVSVLRIAALVIIIIVSPVGKQSVFVCCWVTGFAQTGHRSMDLVPQLGLHELDLRIADSDRNSPDHHCSKVGRWHRRPHRGSHPAVEAGALTC